MMRSVSAKPSLALFNIPSAALLSALIESSVMRIAMVIGSVRACLMSLIMNHSFMQIADAIANVPIMATSSEGRLPLFSFCTGSSFL
jgi:hypothetical protein